MAVSKTGDEQAAAATPVARVEHTLVEVQTRAQTLYDKWSTIPVFAMSLVWIIAIFMEFSRALEPEYRRTGLVLNGMVFIAFVTDFVIRFILDTRKRTFLRRNWYLAVAVVVPPLRILFVINAILRIRRDSSSLAKQIGLVALYVVSLVVFLGALFTLIAEIDAPGSNIDSYGDAVWWAFVTVTTVGYGDFTPITETGRSIAVLIMFTGAAAVGALTAALASWFAALAQRSPDAQRTQEASKISSEQETINALHARIEDLQAHLDAIGAHLGVSGHRRGADGSTTGADATATSGSSAPGGSEEPDGSGVASDAPGATRPSGGE